MRTLITVFGLLALTTPVFASEANHAAESIVPIRMAVPFGLLLLSIAVFPLIANHWWESNRNKAVVCAIFGIPMFLHLTQNNIHALMHTAEEYLSFIALLWALYTISGGIVLRGNLRATPLVNTAFLGIGAVIANIVGTTGASMLLIRPMLRTNKERRRIGHIPLFFIFIVSNIGGMLTPLGDPPLFLGYLKGVPFFWTLRLLPIWLAMNSTLLVIFYCYDRWAWSKEAKMDLVRDVGNEERLRIDGKLNFLWLAGVIGAVFLPTPIREITMIGMGILSIKCTHKEFRTANSFNFHAIQEVGIVFAAIFITMVPALEILRFEGPNLGMDSPWQFFWATGILSSLLDNAPTYLTFISVAQGLDSTGDVLGIPTIMLAAISAGAVLMGAVSYIGNAPNFMVKCIAEESGIKMPSFFGYCGISALILFPLFGMVTFLWFLG